MSTSVLDPQFPLHPDEKRIKDPIFELFGYSTAYVFLGFAALTLPIYSWSRYWFISGTPFFLFLLLLGPHGTQVRSPVSIWSIFGLSNTFYALVATSWLAYWIYVAFSWPALLILAISQSSRAQRYVRHHLRHLSRDLQYFQDKIACFKVPALEIDVDVTGLMVLQGITFCFSTFSLEVHGIEVAIKLAEDAQIAIQTEKVIVRLGRSVEIGDVYANFKTSADTGPKLHPEGHKLQHRTTLDQLTDGQTPMKRIDSDTIGGAIDQVKTATDTHFPEDEEEQAKVDYDKRIEQIQRDSTINFARIDMHQNQEEKKELTVKEKKAMISSFLQGQTSVPHPPEWSITVSKLKSLTPPWLHRLNERVPILMRFMLQAVSYLHPVKINGIVAGGSGKFISRTLKEEVFKSYPDENSDIAKLAARIETWLETGNFIAQISKINGLAQVPIMTIYDIQASIRTSTVQIFKVLTEENDIDAEGMQEDKKSIKITIRDKQGVQQEQEKGIAECMRLGGVSAEFSIPSMLLPHHEYLFPPPPASEHKPKETWLEPVEKDMIVNANEDDRLEDEVLQDDFAGEKVENSEQDEKDEVNVDMSLLVSLPAQFNSTLLHFISAVVKATKLVEMEKNSTSLTDGDSKSIAQLSKNMNQSIKDSFKKSVVAATVSDAWIAKMVGKILGAIEDLKGDLGYRMPIEVPLQPRREIQKANHKMYQMQKWP